MRSNTVRVVEIDGQPWFAAADVCSVPGYSPPPPRALDRHVAPQQVRNVAKRDVRAGVFPNRGMTFVTEPGLYDLVFGSKLPQAQEFKHWVTREVLPSIRNDGMDVADEEKVKTGERIGVRQANSFACPLSGVYFHRGNNSTEARCLRLCHCPEFSGEWSPPRSHEAASSDGMRPKSSIAPRKCNDT